MATLNTDSIFQAWTLNDEEFSAGCAFSDTQRKFIQTLISEYAHEKVALTFTEENKQREAELAGSILALRYLLDVHKTLTHVKE